MQTYFPNLNALRFFAATMVVIFHIELYKLFYGLPNVFYLPFFQIIGKLSVVLFFVLSGFLISSLLLKEKDKHHKINFKNFYLRRIFRIWPLYFLILILGFFVLPYFAYWDIPNPIFRPVEENFWQKLLMYIFILPNLAVSLYGEIVGASQSWSLGTEEQFYLFWPLIIAIFRKRLLLIMVTLLIFYVALALFFGKAASINPIFINVSKFWSLFNINCMAIGGIFAVLYHDQHRFILKILFNKLVFVSTVIYLMLSLALGIKYGFIHYEVYSILFSIIIINLACNQRYSTVLEFRPLNYMGSVSYGIYMFHPIILPAVIYAEKYCGGGNLFIYILTLGLTFFISAFSFEYLEKYFLRLKNKFA